MLRVCALVLAGVAAAGDADALSRDLDLHTGFLSSPELAIRRPGEPAMAVAARYISEELRRLGFEGGGPRGARTQHATVGMTPRAEDCLLILRGREGTIRFAPEREFRPLASGGAGTVVAPVIFVSRAEDLSDSIRGRIVLLLGADAAAVATAAARGPAAILVAKDPRRDTVDRVTFADGRTAVGDVRDRGTEFLFTDRATGEITRLTKEMVREIELDLPPGPPGRPGGEIAAAKTFAAPVFGVSAGVTAAILGADPMEVLAGVSAGVRPRVFPAEGGTVRLVVPKEGRKATLTSVVARRPGTDPRASRLAVRVRVRYDAGDDGAATALALAAELQRRKAGLRPVLISFLPGGGETLPPGEIAITATGEKRARRVPVGRPGEREAAIAAVRVASRIIRELANVPRPAPGPGRPPPAPAAGKPAPPKGTLDAVRRARYAGRLLEADRELAAALAKSPKDPALRMERARILIARKKWEEAFAEVRELEALSKTDGRADHVRFEIHEARGELKDAGEALLRAVRAEFPEAMVEWVLRLPGDQPGALSAAGTVLRKLVQAAPDTAWGKFAAGLHLYRRRNLAGAEKYFGETVERDPLLGSAWFWRGKARSEAGRDPTDVAKDFDRAEEFGFKSPSVNFERGLCRLRSKMYTLAIREFSTYLKEVPTDSAAIYNIACAHALMRNTDEALDWLARSIDAGFGEMEHARSDPDLESIRNDPRFEALLSSKRTD